MTQPKAPEMPGMLRVVMQDECVSRHHREVTSSWAFDDGFYTAYCAMLSLGWQPPEKIERLYQMLYRLRPTGGGIGGCAMTTFTCIKCDESAVHHNTAVPLFCKGCSKALAEFNASGKGGA